MIGAGANPVKFTPRRYQGKIGQELVRPMEEAKKKKVAEQDEGRSKKPGHESLFKPKSRIYEELVKPTKREPGKGFGAGLLGECPKNMIAGDVLPETEKEDKKAPQTAGEKPAKKFVEPENK